MAGEGARRNAVFGYLVALVRPLQAILLHVKKPPPVQSNPGKIEGVHAVIRAGQVVVIEDDYRDLVFIGQVKGLNRTPESLLNRGGRQNRAREIPMVRVNGKKEVPLLRPGGQTHRRPRPL